MLKEKIIDDKIEEMIIQLGDAEDDSDSDLEYEDDDDDDDDDDFDKAFTPLN